MGFAVSFHTYVVCKKCSVCRNFTATADTCSFATSHERHRIVVRPEYSPTWTSDFVTCVQEPSGMLQPSMYEQVLLVEYIYN